LIILIYSRLTYLTKPYKRKILNQLDSFSSFSIFASFQFALLNFTSTNEVFQPIYFALLILTNVMYFLQFLKLVVSDKISYNEKSWYYPIIVRLKEIFPKAIDRFTIKIESSIRSHKAWQKLRAILKVHRLKSRTLGLSLN